MRVQIAPTESLSLLLKQIPPIYPAAAREAKIEGSVVLNAVINKDGNVGELSVVSGNPMLVQAAIDAVKQWVYRPYYRGGVPMDVETLVVVEFSLASERAAVGGGN
jgi:protein TonB